MGGGGILPGLGAPSLRSTTHTLNPLTIYLDPNGDDDAPGDASNPKQTPAGVMRAVPDQIDHLTRVFVAPGAYALPAAGLGALSLNELISWEAQSDRVLTTRAAGAGTTATSIVGAFTANEYRGKSIRFTSGAAIGQTKTLRNNTTTALVPSCDFSPAPSDGDTYEIFETNVTWDMTAGGFAQMLVTGGGNPLGNNNVAGMIDQQGWLFKGIKFAGTATLGVRNSYVMLYGCEYDGIFFTPVYARVALGCDMGDLAAGPQALVPQRFGEAADAWLGWGGHSFGGSFPGNFLGHAYTEAAGHVLDGGGQLTALGGELFIWGGSFSDAPGTMVSVQRQTMASFNRIRAAAPDCTIAASSNDNGLVCDTRSYTRVRNTTINTFSGTGLWARGGSYVDIDDTVTGESATGTSLLCLEGARVELAAAAAFGRGGGATDWRVDATSFDPAVGLAAPNTAQVGAKGAVIEREAS